MVNYPKDILDISNAFEYYHGAGSALSGFLLLAIYGFVGLEVTEFHWNIPFSFLGVLTVLFVYSFVYYLTRDYKAAFFTALLIAVSPLHIGITRGIGYAQHSMTQLLHITTIFSFFIFFRKPEIRNALLASTSLSLLVLFDLLFPFVFPIILYILWTSDKSKLNEFKPLVCKRFIRPVFLIPASVIVLKLVFFFKNYNSEVIVGSVMYSLVRSGLNIGFHIKPFLINLVFYLGIVILFASAIPAVRKVRGVLSGDYWGFLLIWFLSISLPFLFFFDRCVTNYIVFPLTPLIMLSGIYYGSRIGFSGLSGIIPILVVILMLVLFFNHSLEQIFDSGFLGIKDLYNGIYCRSFYSSCMFNPCGHEFSGKIYPDDGYKAVSYWIRMNTPVNSIVFSDNYGVMGKQKNIRYYLHRELTNINAGSRDDMLGLFESEKHSFDVLIITPSNIHFLKGMEDFIRTVIIVDNNGDHLSYVYTRKKYYDGPVELNVIGLNHEYDTQYSRFNHIVG